MSGYIGPSPVPQSIQRRQSFTATAGQTTFGTTGYTDGDFIDVYLNGVKLVGGTDYTATNGTDIVLTTAASASDVLDFVTFNSLSLANHTFDDSITLQNATEEDTDGGRESTIIFKGEQSGGEISTLAEIEASHDGTSDDEKGDLIFRTNDGSDGSSPTERMRVDSSGNVGIGTSSPSAVGSRSTVNISGSAGGAIRLSDDTANMFIDYTDGSGARISVNANEPLTLRTNSADRMTVDGSGNVGINNTSPAHPLDVSGDSRFAGDVDVYSTTGGAVNSKLLYFGSAALPQAGAVYSATATSTQGSLILACSQGGTGVMTERLRITNSGITFNGDTAAANALDDYEEGSFTPTVDSASWVGTYQSTNNGRYTKIGRLVTFSFNLDLTSSSTLPTGEVVFGGLPYASATASGALAAPRFPFHSYNVNYDSVSSTHMMGYIPTGGSTQIKVLAARDNNTWATVNHGTGTNQLQFSSGRTLMIFNGFYHANS